MTAPASDAPARRGGRIRTTLQRSERYERERVDASVRHKRKLEQMIERRGHEEQESQDRLEETASA